MARHREVGSSTCRARSHRRGDCRARRLGSALEPPLREDQQRAGQSQGSPSAFSGCCPAGTDTQTGAGSAEDDAGHGTAVAGIITSGGVVAPMGVSRDASLVAIKVLDANGNGNFADVAAGLDWLLSHHVSLGVTVVNLSFGDGGEHANPAASPCSNTLTAFAINDLVADGVAVFVASGNDAHTDGISFPACVASAISVGGVYDGALGNVGWCGATCGTVLCTDYSTGPDDFVCHTNSDETLDLLAPDWRTLTSQMGGTANNFSGTSAAAPYAAALAVLLLERDPALTPATLRTLMKTNGPLVHNAANGLDHRRTDIATFFGLCGNGSLELDEACDDGNTSDGDCCSSDCGFEALGADCSDDSACTVDDACDGVGVCVSGSPLVCDDGAFCNGSESCDPATGCGIGVPPILDDGVVCTVDTCDEVGDVVAHTPNPLVCDDGAFCNGAEVCDPVLDCQTGVPPVLDDGVSCSVDVCDEALDIVVHDPDPGACDDSDPCTAESCDAVTGCANTTIAQCAVPVPAGGAPLAWWIASALAGVGVVRLRASRRGAGRSSTRLTAQ